jgi:uncharacterized protein YcbX
MIVGSGTIAGFARIWSLVRMSDLHCQLSALTLYPVKSCGGTDVRESLLIETGLDLDRAWMVVDSHGEMLTQREHARLALVQTSLRHDDVVLRAPGMLPLHLAASAVEAPTRVRVWDDVVKAYDMGALAAQWFSDFLGVPGLRLARFDPDQKRLSERRWTGSLEAENAFSDGFPLLVASTASLAEVNRRLAAAGHPAVAMSRFRPNLVLDGLTDAHAEDRIDTLEIEAEGGPVVLKLVKPCARCTIPDIDPATAAAGHAVGATLATYRADARVAGGLTFGMNAVIVQGIDCVLRVGATVRATLAS